MSMIILGLTGPAGCGKTTLAHYLVTHHGFVEISLADPIRDMIAALLRVDRSVFDAMIADRGAKEAPLPDIGASPRRLMQTLGTEWGRTLISLDLWVNLVRERIDYIEQALRHEYAGIVISDVRFENEATFVREQGLLLHIARPDLVPIEKHESETGVKLHHRDQLILNQTIELLHQQADGWVRDMQRRAAA